MDEKELKRDWLAGNGVVCFVAAVMVTQTWQSPSESYTLPFIGATLPFPDPLSFALLSVLFVLGVCLVLASLVPLGRLHERVISAVGTFSAVLDLFVWIAFLGGWVAMLSPLPDRQWLVYVVFWGGLAIVILLGLKFLRSLCRTVDSSRFDRC